MSILTFVAASPGLKGATVNLGNGQLFDIEAALIAGSGVITVDDSVNQPLAQALRGSPAVIIQGTTPGTPVSPIQYGPVSAYVNGPATGDVLIRASDGQFHNQPQSQLTGGGGGGGGGVSIAGDLGGTTANPTVVGLQNRAVSSSAPLANQALVWNGSAWAPATQAGGMVNPMTTANDLIVGGVSGAPTKLAKGAEAQVLAVQGGAVSWKTLLIGSFFNVIIDTPEAHGAKRDGKVLTDIVMTAGSGVLQSASAPFTAADATAQKTFMITSVGNHGAGNVLIGKIASYQSPTQVTLDTTATHPFTGAVGVYGTDDTAAIKAAIASVVSQGQITNAYYGEVWFSAGIYVVAGALDSSQHGYAQIPLPYQPPNGMKFTLGLKGTLDNTALTHWSQPEPQMTGTVLVSAIYPVGSPGGYSGTLGIPSCIGGPTHEQGYGQGNNGTFSNMLLITDGLTITLPFDHTQHGLDTFGLAEHNVPNFASFALGTVVGGNWWPNLTPTQGFYYGGGWMACGLVMPNAGNNDNCNIGLYSAEGLTGGIALGEHTHADSIRCINCDIDVTMTCGPDGTAINDHSMDISYLSTEASRIHIFVPSIGTYAQILNIFNWDPEDGGEANWHIYNANALRGEINVNLQMVNQPFKINGSCGANIANTFRAPGAPFDGSPAVPAFGTPLVNPFWRKAAVNVGGAGLTGVTIDGQAQSVVPGTYIVPSGKSITLSGTGTVQWSWILL